MSIEDHENAIIRSFFKNGRNMDSAMVDCIYNLHIEIQTLGPSERSIKNSQVKMKHILSTLEKNPVFRTVKINKGFYVAVLAEHTKKHFPK